MGNSEQQKEETRKGDERISDETPFVVEDAPKYDVAWAFAFMNGLPEPPVLREG